MVPQPKCRYSFLFSDFLNVGPVPVGAVITVEEFAKSGSGLFVKKQLQTLFRACAVTRRLKKAVRNDMKYGIFTFVFTFIYFVFPCFECYAGYTSTGSCATTRAWARPCRPRPSSPPHTSSSNAPSQRYLSASSYSKSRTSDHLGFRGLGFNVVDGCHGEKAVVSPRVGRKSN